MHSLQSRDFDSQPGLVEVTAELHRHGSDDVALETAVSRLSLEPGISSVSWNASEAAALIVAGH